MSAISDLAALNERVGVAESVGDHAFFDALLDPAFAMVRPTGRVDGRAEFLRGLTADAQRRTAIVEVRLLGRLRAVVMCAVTKWPAGTPEPDDAQVYDNLRVFVRSDESSPWRLLTWANEPA